MSQTIVIFGASGDLTSRKLIPALYRLHRKNRLPEGTQVVGVSRTAYEHDQWRDSLAVLAEKYVGDEFDAQAWAEFAKSVFYFAGDIKKPEDFHALGDFLTKLEGDQPAERTYYLATMPSLYSVAAANLGAAGLAAEDQAKRRLIVEKPFGVDLPSAKALNHDLHEVFEEHQIYRIDHYLGKETVQNLMVLRFANSIFEPLWNRNYIDHVQITVAEEVMIGSRAGYYETSGVLRDMFQNHILQLLMICAMEAPVRYAANSVRDEKVKVLQAVRPMHGADYAQDTRRGQYLGYLDEPGVEPGSPTETFGVIKLHVDNWRWKGVPFYLRSGKALSCRTTQIVIQFREPPHMLFTGGVRRRMDANRLVIQIQPAEGIQLHFLTKVPDAGMRMRLTDLDFSFQREFAGSIPDAYQRLLLDAISGDASLFARSDEVELAWQIIDPIIAAWRSPAAPELEIYEPGNWGPVGITDWMDKQGRNWFDVCPVLQ